MLLTELNNLVKAHRLKNCSHMNKPELMEMLVSRGILSKEVVLQQPLPSEKTCKVLNRDHTYLKSIRTNGRIVEISHIETGEIHKFPSIYSVAKFLKVNPGLVCHRHNNKKPIEQYEIIIKDRVQIP